MSEIIEEIKKEIPSKYNITDTYFEGANIILYTKNKEFFLDSKNIIKKVVDKIKKRVELRPDPSLCLDMEKTEAAIRKLIPNDAGLHNVIFDPQRSVVVIETEKPGLAIGKQGEILAEIRKKTLWVPVVERTPTIKSKITENIKAVLYQNNDYRKKFLNKVGHRIYDGWLREKKEEWIRMTVLGGGRQVGRSAILLQTPESRILLDCGINPGDTNSDLYPYLESPDFKLSELDAVILTHAHMDHSGFVPFLFKMGYRGPVYCTAPTRDIASLLALDFIGISFKQAKKNIYDVEDVKEMVKHTIVLDWEEVTDITPDVRLTLYNAGHILGSSLCHLHIGNGLHNLVYTGDLKCIKTKLLDPAATNFPRLETILIEGTYGGKQDILRSRRDAESEFIEIINNTVDRGGKILIPVLGVGRSQEAMMVIENAMREGLMKKVPVYIQGMVWDITAIHTAYPDFLNRELRRMIFHKDQNPFLGEVFTRVGSKKEQDKIIEEEGPCIILSTAGMLNAGASVEYFKALASNPKNTMILIVHQVVGTMGRRVQEGEREFVLQSNGKPDHISVKMGIHTIPAFTGHAGRNELIKYIHNLNPKPKKVIINHGEVSKCIDLASSIYKLARVETIVPKNLESVRLR